MAAPQECRREPIARSFVGSIDVCGCGSIHLSIGPVTVRLEGDSFDQLAEMMAAARLRLRSRRAHAMPPRFYAGVSDDPA